MQIITDILTAAQYKLIYTLLGTTRANISCRNYFRPWQCVYMGDGVGWVVVFNRLIHNMSGLSNMYCEKSDYSFPGVWDFDTFLAPLCHLAVELFKCQLVRRRRRQRRRRQL